MKPAIDLRNLAVAFVALLLLPVGAIAQTHPELDRLHDEAIALAYDGAADGIEKAVLMHGMVVHQRTEEDVRRFECLKSHANLLYFYGRLDGARDYMQAAAEQAEAEGRDYEAAMTYVEAAILAKEAGDLAAVSKLAGYATDLSTSARLTRDQRHEILDRIGQ